MVDPIVGDLGSDGRSIDCGEASMPISIRVWLDIDCGTEVSFVDDDAGVPVLAYVCSRGGTG